MTAAYLAIDWGTTNRRIYAMSDHGTVVDVVRDDRGVLTVSPGNYSAELRNLRERLGKLPVIAAGMIGSTKGWREAPYLPVPASLVDLSAGLLRIEEEDFAIIPGLMIDSAGMSDVMRGEEVQILGAVAASLAPADALFCQPGTHNKWVDVTGGRITRFVTAMTGEIFGLLRDHSVLADMLGGDVADNDAFRAGVRRAASGRDLLTALFGVRALVLAGRHSTEESAAYASGLLIGADVAARDLPSGAPVYLLADRHLGALYAAALDVLGRQSIALDSQAAFTAGIHQIWKNCQ